MLHYFNVKNYQISLYLYYEYFTITGIAWFLPESPISLLKPDNELKKTKKEKPICDTLLKFKQF